MGSLKECENLKEELRGEVDEALEKYRFAGVFLTCLEVKKEDDKVAFFALASNITLNMAMCFLKKKELLQVGQLCTMVLNFDSQNVKALFRRSLAAIELGRHDLLSEI
ncbi:70 kDa peptidyl-prolyl isomerase [Bienertia sinuspersici]